MRPNFTRSVLAIVAWVAFLPSLSHATPTQDFEGGTLDGWTVGGRRLGSNWWGVADYGGSKMAYIHHRSFTELELARTFDFNPAMNLSFDAEFSINGDTSVTASGGSDFYSMVRYGIQLLDSDGAVLDSALFSAATTRFPYSGWHEFHPNGLQSYSHDIEVLANDLGIPIADITQVRLSFGGYSSWWSNDNMIVRFDNVAVPEPSSAALAAMGLAGIAAAGRRRIQ